MRAGITLTAMLAVITTAAFAQSGGADMYKAKCQMCHGAAGMADSPAGKAMKVKPVTDEDVKKLSEAQMIAATKDGMGKMKGYKDSLSDEQIKEVVGHFRTFLK